VYFVVTRAGFLVTVFVFIYLGVKIGVFVTYVCGVLGSDFLCFVALGFCLYLFILVVMFVPLLCCTLTGCTSTLFCILPDDGSVSRDMSPNF
jgi:hypothetical protein